MGCTAPSLSLDAIPRIPEQDDSTREMRNAQDVLSVVLVERDEAASFVELGKQAPDLPPQGR